VEKLERIALYSRYGTKLPLILSQKLDNFDTDNSISLESLLPEIETISLSDKEYEDILHGKNLGKENIEN
jgi:hypothetical protein